MAPADVEPMALVWIEILDQHNVPWHLYDALFLRAMATRAAVIGRGGNVQHLTATDLVTEYNGPYGLAAEIARKQQIKQLDRPYCQTCDNTGWKRKTVNGYPGVIRCNHTTDG